MDPFKLVETSPGKFSLLLSEFQPAGEVFDESGLEGGGYAWDSIARHLVEKDAPELADKLGFDPEGSMFCAYGTDRDALTTLGGHLAKLFNDHDALRKTIAAIGPENFDD